MLSFPNNIANNPARKGELAARKQFLRGYRYAVAPVHTRFGAVEWFVWDAEHPTSEMFNPAVIRQAATLDEAIKGL
jgi:hypothetical protein